MSACLREGTIQFKFHTLWRYQVLLKKEKKTVMDHMMLIPLRGLIFLWLLHQ